jgi:hypothetical protein
MRVARLFRATVPATLVKKETAMNIELSEEQRQAILKGGPVRLALPEIGEEVVLLRATAYEEMKEALEDEQVRKAFRAAGLRSAIRWLGEPV